MKLFTYPYSQTYMPSMPVIELGVSQPGSRQPDQTVSAVIDSGADGTLIEVSALEAVGAAYVGEAIIRGISGPGQHIDVYLVSLHIGSHMLHAVRVLAVADGSESILRRNVLQHLVVTLNGPAGVTEISG